MPDKAGFGLNRRMASSSLVTATPDTSAVSTGWFHEAPTKLCAPVVHFIGLAGLQRADQRALVGQVAVDDAHIASDAQLVQAPIHMVGAAASDQPVNFASLFQQQFGQIGAVLAGHPGNQCVFARKICFPGAPGSFDFYA